MSMHSICGSAVVAKYERPFVKIGRPARENSSSVASCKLPFGRPSLIFMVAPPVVQWLPHLCRLRKQRLGEAGARALVTDEPCALDFDVQQKRVAVAISSDGYHLEPVARSLSFCPQLLAAAAEECSVARTERALAG